MGGEIREEMLKEVEKRSTGNQHAEGLRRSLSEKGPPHTPQISADEFKRLIDEPERKRRALESPHNEREGSSDPERTGRLWEANFVPVKSYLPDGSVLVVPPNLTIFKGAEYYYDRDLESFTHRTRATAYSESEDKESDDSSSLTDSSSGSLRASSLPPTSSPSSQAKVRRAASCPVEPQSDSE